MVNYRIESRSQWDFRKILKRFLQESGDIAAEAARRAHYESPREKVLRKAKAAAQYDRRQARAEEYRVRKAEESAR